MARGGEAEDSMRDPIETAIAWRRFFLSVVLSAALGFAIGAVVLRLLT